MPDGKYPFFTCAEAPDTIDSYAFDDDVVLVAGNNANGNFHVNRYIGQFNAYQRTYVLTAKPPHDINYIYYSLKLELKRLKERSQGSQTKFLTMPILTGIHLQEENGRKQSRVASVLKCIDAKIDLNNRINAELEAIVKTLYDYWFVQFDFPNVNGKPFKSSGGKMVYNEILKREIPEGWGIIELEQMAELIKGNVTPEEISSNTPYIGLEHIPRKSIILSEWETAKKVSSDKCVFKKNDILFGKIRPYFHKVGIAFVDGITSTDTIVLRPKNNLFFGFVLETVFSDQFIITATQSSTGTKMPRANWDVLRKFSVPAPPTQLLDKYQNTFSCLIAGMESSVYQNKELSKLRDWLLPMLMNGQVTVK